MNSNITFEISDHISRIKMDDGKVNVFSIEMLENFREMLSKVPRDKGALIISGRPGIFSGGFNLKTFQSGDVEQITKMLKLGFETLYDVYTFPRPVIAEVTGHAIALGIFLVSCCDYRIGAKGDYVLQANEVRNKMSIPTQLIEIAASRVQKAHIYRALFHAEPYPIKIGVDAGWLDELTEPEELSKRVLEKAKDLGGLGHPHYKETKETLLGDNYKKIKAAIL